MRTFFPTHLHTQTTPIEGVVFQLHCRHELIPILIALQHIYQCEDVRQEILQLIANDVNGTSNAQRGRTGMSYWEILVLAAVRLGCNLDYDALQDLATNHRLLRQIMGVDDDGVNYAPSTTYAWHRLRDNICLIMPKTLERINQLVVSLGHDIEPGGPEHVRGDAFVVETNIHYPTESSLLGDGLRKILDIVDKVGRVKPLPGWRKRLLLRKRLKRALRCVALASRSKKQNATQMQQRAYCQLYKLTHHILAKAQTLEGELAAPPSTPDTIEQAVLSKLAKELQVFCERTRKVLSYSRRRVLHGEKIANEEKLFSMFEHETQLINRGKTPHPIQFGHNVLVVEDTLGFIVRYRVVPSEKTEKSIVVAEMRDAQRDLENKIKSASFDKGFHSTENQAKLSEFIPEVCIPLPGAKQRKEQQSSASWAFVTARQAHPGVESLIGVLQRGNGQKRCRDRGTLGYERYVGLGILGRNLQVLGQVVLRQRGEVGPATQSKRKAPWAA